MIKRTLIVPGLTVLAMRMAMIDVRDWLEKMLTKWNPSGPVINPDFVISIQFREPVRGQFTRDENAQFFLITGEESNICEFEMEINKRIYGLLTSLTQRETQVLRKRLVEDKSITETASQMEITPQGVVAFMSSIKKKVQKRLLKEA